MPCVGLLVVVVGTFLPWLQSGRATRNSYAADGAVRRLLDVSGPVDAALRMWPFVSLLCAVAAAAVILGILKIGFGLSMMAAVISGSVATVALAASPHGLVRPASAGPAVTLAGAIVAVIGALCALVLERHSGRVSRDVSI